MTELVDRVKELRTQRYTLQQIADMIGTSRQYVSLVLRAVGVTGRIERPELLDPATYLKSDDQVASELGISLNRVIASRRALKIKKKRMIDIPRRRQNFTRSVFDKEPGPNFVDIREIIEQRLPKDEAERITSFYIDGAEGCVGNQRVLRSQANTLLRETTLDRDIEVFVAMGVLK